MSERYITPAFFCIDQTKRQFSIIVFQIMVLNYEKSKSEKFPRLSAHTYTQSPEYYVVRKLKVYCNSSNCNVWNILVLVAWLSWNVKKSFETVRQPGTSPRMGTGRRYLRKCGCIEHTGLKDTDTFQLTTLKPPGT